MGLFMLMMYCILSLTWMLMLQLQSVYGYSVDVKPKESECYIIETTKGTHCSGSFEILSENSSPVQVMVKGPPPMKAVLFDAKFHGEGGLDPTETEGSFSFKAEYDGDHKMCIMNGKRLFIFFSWDLSPYCHSRIQISNSCFSIIIYL